MFEGVALAVDLGIGQGRQEGGDLALLVVNDVSELAAGPVLNRSLSGDQSLDVVSQHGEHGRTSVLDLLHLGGDGGKKTCTASGWGLARQGQSRASATRKEVLASPPTHVHRACTGKKELTWERPAQ